MADKPFYGNGTNEISGITLTGHNIDAEYEDTTNALDAIKATLALLPKKKKVEGKNKI